jgi:hypothetical protein
MSAQQEISDLDASLATDGEIIKLQRGRTDGPGYIEIDLPAFVRPTGSSTLIDGVLQQDIKVIISPTVINAQNWPGPEEGTGDPRIPRKGDRAITSQGTSVVQVGRGIKVENTVVRIEFTARGNA